jgi:hypothetical protein
MESGERSCVFFRKPEVGLDEAEAELRAGGMTVRRDADALQASWQDSPPLTIRLVRGDGIRKDAVRLGRGKPQEAAMRPCDAAFIITFRDLDEVLDDANALIEVQLRLQKITDGVIARSWNDELSAPEGEGT